MLQVNARLNLRHGGLDGAGPGRLWVTIMKLRPLLALALLALSAPLAAESDKPPFWSVMKAKLVNMRVGPGEAYRIAWVYHRPMMPLKVLRVMDGWWLVEDPDGAKGWVLSSLMNRKRHGAMVTGTGLAEMHAEPDATSRLLWRLEPGVTGKLGDCEAGWCKLELEGGRAGWVEQARLWGAEELGK